MNRRMPKVRLLLGFGAVFAVTFVAAACGADEGITKAELEEALAAAAQPAPAPAPTGPSAAEISALVSAAVAAAAPPGISSADIAAAVEAAVESAAGEAVTAADIEALVGKAVEDAISGGPTPLSASEVQGIVAAAVAAIPTPAPTGPSAAEISALVSAAVAAAAPPGISSADIAAAVEAAVESAGGEAVTAADIEALVGKAVEDAISGGPTPLSASEVQGIVAAAVAAIPTPAPVVVERVVLAPVQFVVPPFAKYGGIVNVFVDDPNISTWDIMQEGGGGIFHGTGGINSGLIQFDPRDETSSFIIGDLATEWEISDRADQFTFLLRQDAVFHDGHPVTSEDIKFSFDRTASPPEGLVSTRAKLYSGIDSIQTPGDYTVEFKLDSPDVAFLASLAVPLAIIWPKHISDELGIHAFEIPGAKNQIGSGPFKFKDFVIAERIVLERNPSYYRPGLPLLDGRVGHLITDRDVKLTAFLAGQIDVHFNLTETEAEIVNAQARDRIVVTRVPSLGVQVMYGSINVPPWDDRRVRQALNLAIDRDRYMALSGLNGKVGGILPPGSQFARTNDELAKLLGYGSDMEARIQEAKALLAEAGFPDGLGVTWTALGYSGFPASESQAAVIPGMLEKIGISSDPTLGESQRSAQLRAQGDFVWFMTAHSVPSADIDSFISQYLICEGGRNYGKNCNPTLDALYLKQKSLVNPEERKVALQEIERLALEDSAFVPLFWEPSIMGYQSHVKDLFNSPLSQAVQQKFEIVWFDQ